MKSTFKLLTLQTGKGASTPTAITATSGSGQSANCAAAYANPLVATITPALSGISVTFTAPATGPSGTFASTSTNTESALTVAGVATSSVFTANTTFNGAYNVVASVGALSCNFSLTNRESPAQLLAAAPGIVQWWSTESVLWQDAARTVPAGADGDPVAVPDNLVAGGATASQATDAARPILRIIGGQKTFQLFYGSGWVTGSLVPYPSKRGCIFITLRPLSGNAYSVIAATYNQAGTNFICYFSQSGPTKYKFYDGTFRNAAQFDTVNTAYIFQFWRNGDTSMKFYRNATLADTLTLANAQPSTLPLYLGGSSFGYEFIGFINDIILTGDIDDTQRQTILTYLSGRPAPVYSGLYGNCVGYGDSITAGDGASDAAHRWLNIVASDTKSRMLFVVNSGIAGTVLQNTVQNSVAVIGGAATNNGQDTLTARVLAYNPARVLVLYGLNDLRLNDAAFTTTTFQNALSAVVDAIIANGTPAAQIVLGSPPYVNPANYATFAAPFNGGSTVKHQAYRDAVAAVATAKGTRYIDIYQAMIDGGGNTLLSADNLHPNDTGHAVIAAAFLSVL